MSGSVVMASIDAAAATDESAWSAAARSADLVELLEAQERLAALVQLRVGTWDRDQCWAADDALSPVSWLMHRVPLTRQDAMAMVRTARHVTARSSIPSTSR